MNPGTEELFPDPNLFHTVPVYKLLTAAARGYVAVDHRFLHAILDRGEDAVLDLVQFAAEDHDDDAIELDEVLLDIFRIVRTPQAVLFLMELVRRAPTEVSDELVETIAQLGAAATGPLLQILKELEEQGKDTGDLPFLLSQLGVRDLRILAALAALLEKGDPDAALFLDMYGDPAAVPALEAAMNRLPAEDIDRVRIQSFITDLATQSSAERVEEQEEPFDIWALYPERESPPVDFLEEDDRLRMLASGPPESRIAVAACYRGADLPDRLAARLLDHAKNDPDLRVRGECWEALQDRSNEPEMRRAMLAVLKNPEASIEEKSGVAAAMALQSDNPAVYQAIENVYADPRGRAKALKAMGRSFDKRFSLYPPKHLDDPDPDVKRQAIWATGYLNLTSEAPRLEAFLEDDKFRSDALFAYALTVPGETSRGRIQALMDKICEAAGGLRPDEEALVEVALDQRLIMRGKSPVFTPGDSDEFEDTPEMPAASTKVGRNDPCPCGSGKKYKKCCGA